MKSIIALTLLVGLVQSAYSMPCDTGYSCESKSGKYKIELQRCRYRNDIRLVSMSINNTDIPSAVLNKGWDGETTLAFEINLPTMSSGAVKILTAELPGKHKGVMKIKYAASEPGPLSTLYTEKVFCKIED